MGQRLLRTLITLAVVLTAHFIYALAVVPWIEPTVARLSGDDHPIPADLRRSATHPYRHLLARYFSEDSWVMQHPKLIESQQGMLLVKDYHPLGDSMVELEPLAMIFVPDEDAKVDPSRAGEAVVLEAAKAVLQFDRPLDLSRGRIGKLIEARLVGKVTIRSDQRSLGPEDDLLIVTRDILLRDDRIWTPAPVDLRLGPHHGSARELLIRLEPKQSGSPGDRRGSQLGALRSLELMRDVQMHFQLGAAGLLPGAATHGRAYAPSAASGPTAAADPSSPADDAAPARLHAGDNPTTAPARITCRGPFRFDFRKHEASFQDQVDVVRLHPAGESDQLTCELLAIQFAPRASPDSSGTRAAPHTSAPHTPASPAAQASSAASTSRATSASAASASTGFPTSQSPGDFPSLEPRRLRAKGNPVVVRSPSRGASARCELLEYDLRTGRIRLEHSDRVMLRYERNQVQAPLVVYQPGPDGRLGEIESSGPGWLEAELESRPGQTFRADWNGDFKLRPHEGRQLVSLVGGARVSYAALGSLAADEIWLWLHEQDTGALPRDPAASPDPSLSSVSPAAARVTPDRLLALGKVRIDSPQLVGDPGRFEVWFQSADGGAAWPSPGANRGPDEVAGGRASAAASDRLDSPRDHRPPPGSRFEIAGQLLRVHVLLADGEAQVEDVHVAGNVTLVETQTGQPDELPLVMQGDQLVVRGASSDRTHAAIEGRPARIEARGLVMSGAKIQLDRAVNRLWIDDAGTAVLPIDRDLGGNKIDEPQSLTVTWRDRMVFDGRTVRCEGQVEARGATQRMETETLEVRLTQPVDFARPPRQRDQVQVAQIICQGGVLMENRAYDEHGLLCVDTISTRDLSVDQTSGAIAAAGPGWVKSVRRGQPLARSPDTARTNAGGSAAAGPAGTLPVSSPISSVAARSPDSSPVSSPAGAQRDPLNYLYVTFQREATGNLHHRELALQDRVRTLYGPVADWNQTLEFEPHQELPPGVVSVRCDRLGLVQLAPVRDGRGTIEFEALGNTIVEGSTFTARADRMTYAEAKDLLILEGTGRTDAELWRQTRVGAPTSKAAARKIFYWQGTGRVEVDDAKFLNIGQ